MSNPLGELLSITGLSLRVSMTAVILASLIGIPFGAWLGLTRSRLRGALVALVYTGMALPPVVVGLVVYILLSRAGPLAFLGWLFTVQAMILAQTLLAVPFVAGITMVSIRAVPAELPLQLRSLGATASQVRRALLREARPGVLLAVAAALGRSLSEVGAVLIVGGNIHGHTRVLTTAIVLETAQGRFAFALLLGSVLLAFALLANTGIVHLQSPAWKR